MKLRAILLASALALGMAVPAAAHVYTPPAPAAAALAPPAPATAARAPATAAAGMVASATTDLNLRAGPGMEHAPIAII